MTNATNTTKISPKLKACRYGATCQRSNCIFVHPTTPTPLQVDQPSLTTDNKNKHNPDKTAEDNRNKTDKNHESEKSHHQHNKTKKNKNHRRNDQDMHCNNNDDATPVSTVASPRSSRDPPGHTDYCGTDVNPSDPVSLEKPSVFPGPKSATPCRYGDRCRRPKCPFGHDHDNNKANDKAINKASDKASDEVNEKMKEKADKRTNDAILTNSIETMVSPIKIQSKKTTSSCPDTEAYRSLFSPIVTSSTHSTNKTPKGKGVSTKPCRYGTTCRRVDCYFAHPTPPMTTPTTLSSHDGDTEVDLESPPVVVVEQGATVHRKTKRLSKNHKRKKNKKNRNKKDKNKPVSDHPRVGWECHGCRFWNTNPDFLACQVCGQMIPIILPQVSDSEESEIVYEDWSDHDETGPNEEKNNDDEEINSSGPTEANGKEIGTVDEDEQLVKDAAQQEPAMIPTPDIATESTMDDETQARYKAQRNAAKKERRRLEREIKNAATNQDSTPNKTTSQNAKRHKDDDDMANLEASTPPATTDSTLSQRRLSRKEQKQLRYERYLEQVEQQNNERADSWKDIIARQEQAVGRLMDFCVAEFVRQSGLDRKNLGHDPEVQSKLLPQCSRAALELMEVPTRVVVRGMPSKQTDLNDRTGTIRYWDSAKKQFCVGLDTKKAKNTSTLFFSCENLEAMTHASQVKSKKASDSDRVFVLNMSNVFGRDSVQVDLCEKEVVELVSSKNPEVVIDHLLNQRTQEEIRVKKEQEYLKEQEERARREHTEKLHREQQAHDERRRHYNDMKKMRKEQRKQWAREHGTSNYDFSHPFGCSCRRCILETMFANFFFTGSAEGGSGGFSFEYRHDDYEDSGYDWDRRYEEMEEEDTQEKLEAAARVLGVDENASESDIKRVYRRKALQYHPDRFKSEYHNGMSKEEAEDHIKELNSAYALLCSQFDS